MTAPSTPAVHAPGVGQSEQAALFAFAYDELKKLARRALRDRHLAETIDTTAMVHEVFLKIRVRDEARDSDPQYLRALAARAMRQILVDRARRRMSAKRGLGAGHVTLGGIDVESDMTPFDLVAVDHALVELETLDARLARVVELHVFAGMSMPEIAQALDVAERTVFRDWRTARAFLIERLAGTGKP